MTDVVVIAFFLLLGRKADLATPSGLGLIAGKTYVPRSFCRVANSKQIIISTECASHFYALKILSPPIYLLFSLVCLQLCTLLRCKCAQLNHLRVEASKRAQGGVCCVGGKNEQKTMVLEMKV